MWLAIASALVARENKLINVTLACEHSPVPVKSKSDVLQLNWASVLSLSLSLWWLSRWGACWLPRDLRQAKLEGPIKRPCLVYFSAKFMPSLSFSFFFFPVHRCLVSSLPFSFCMHSWHSVDIPHNQTYMGNRLLLLHCNDSTELGYMREGLFGLEVLQKVLAAHYQDIMHSFYDISVTQKNNAV